MPISNLYPPRIFESLDLAEEALHICQENDEDWFYAIQAIGNDRYKIAVLDETHEFLGYLS